MPDCRRVVRDADTDIIPLQNRFEDADNESGKLRYVDRVESVALDACAALK